MHKRYIPPDGTYSYTAVLDKCVVKNQIDDNDTDSSCPVTIDIAMDEVPHALSRDSYSLDCYNASLPCKMFVKTPYVSRWNYLRFSIHDDLTNFTDENSQNGRVWFCLMKYRIPSLDSVINCDGGIGLNTSTLSNDTTRELLYIPYPEEGKWYIGLHSMCVQKNDSRKSVPCKHLPTIQMDVELSKCIDRQCGKYGVCREYISGLLIYSACDCYGGKDDIEPKDKKSVNCVQAKKVQGDIVVLMVLPLILFLGWRGFGCTDGSNAVSESVALIAVLMLTISNLFFIPGILIALRRGYYVEAFVYLYNMFFSTIKKCYEKRSCFPSKKWYIRHFLPGIVLSGTGLLIFTLLETDDNYKYTHSVWHITISLSIVFFLPPKGHFSGVSTMAVLHTLNTRDEPV
ncbi:hypothetical protein KUTeg_015863 [Tegillarca granosa]|uniref:Transmembrane protein 8B n=1 Tax=Tegillarca granosa TaxID=220873 RepID=A0ABQ9EJ64_TEGGR|nr:hypothetical protein KUTeg_015863 [Tegillarca granosa]